MRNTHRQRSKSTQNDDRNKEIKYDFNVCDVVHKKAENGKKYVDIYQDLTGQEI